MPVYELTAEGFPNINEPFIFVAGSSDVIAYRKRAYCCLQETLRNLGAQGKCRPLTWEIEIGDEGFSQQRSMQKHLPRPSSSCCLGLVAVIGERIGMPLENSFDLALLGDSDLWTQATSGYRLRHPDWPSDIDEQRALVEDGFYPLTGTVFEVLDTIAAKKPLLLGIAAKREIPRDSDDVVLNEYRHYKAALAKIDPSRKAEWDARYGIQTRAVHNFVRALTCECGLGQKLLRSIADIEPPVRTLVATCLRDGEASTTAPQNPYRFLQYFDVDDAENFWGRSTFVRQTVEALNDRFRDCAPAVLCIAGSSGSGKSSVLRAGLMHALEREVQASYTCVPLRPEELSDSGAGAGDAMMMLLDRLEECGAVALALADLRAIRRAGADGPSRAAALVAERLAAENRRLVLGLDQFEEIIDVLRVVEKRRDQWRPLIEFANAAVSTNRIGILYTLESSRGEAHECVDLGPAFRQAVRRELDVSSEMIQEIIDKPFRTAGYRLSSEAIETLVNNFWALRRQDDRGPHNAILPLLALKLSQLFDFIADRYPPEHELLDLHVLNDNRDEGIPAGELDLSFEHLIAKQAQRAWYRGLGTTEIYPEALEHFLMPFVGVSGERIQLTVASRIRPFEDEAKLAEAFRAERLLEPAGQDGLRLVHEAVLRHWEKAWQWYEARRDYLTLEERIRRRAELWHAEGREPGSVVTTPEEAAQVLLAYQRSWLNPESPLPAEEASLRAYCLSAFAKSETPGARVPAFGDRDSNHVTLAALFGVVALLERFRGIDPDSLDRPNPHNSQVVKPLHAAAWYQPDTVGYLLAHRVEPIALDAKGWPAVAVTVRTGQARAFHELLRAIEQTASRSLSEVLACPNGLTLAHVCAMYNRQELLSVLVEDRGFDPTASSKECAQPIHIAARNGAEETLRYLCSRGADVAEPGFHDWTCLHEAAFFGQRSIVQLLLEMGKFNELQGATDDDGENALHLAARARQAECVQALCPHYDPNEIGGRGFAAIHRVFARNAGEPVDAADIIAALEPLLADERTDPGLPDARGRTALKWAEQWPSVQRRLLDDPRLDLAAPIQTNGEPAYAVAARLSHWSAFQRYIDASGDLPLDPDLDGRGNSLLHLLAHRGSPLSLFDSVESSLSPEQLNAPNREGRRPINLAVRWGNWPMVERLIRHPSVQPPTGNHLSFLKKCLARSSSARDDIVNFITKSDSRSRTALHVACAHRHAEWIAHLRDILGQSHALWEQCDAMNRKPLDLLPPRDREGLTPVTNDASWPTPVSWDTNLSWAPLDDDRRRALEASANPVDDELVLDQTTTVEMTRLPFYGDDVRLIRATDARWPVETLHLFFLAKADDFHRLDGKVGAIHKVNASSVCLGPDNVLGYLRFHNFFVRGKDGPFFVVESESVPEVAELDSVEVTAAVARFSHPSWYNGQGRDGFHISAAIFYGDSIFAADLCVQPTGTVEMLDDLAVASGLGTGVNRPIAL